MRFFLQSLGKRGASAKASHIRRGGLLLSLGCVCLSACNITGAREWNLGQLHNPDGSLRRIGSLVSDFEYGARFELLSFVGADGLKRYQSPTPKRIEDPLTESLNNLRRLAAKDPSDPEVRVAQAEWLSHLAVDHPWKLGRERAVLALGELGKRLKLGLERKPSASEYADPASVREPLKAILLATQARLGLVNLRALAEQQQTPPEEDQPLSPETQPEADLGAFSDGMEVAIDELSALTLSREGALSALRGVRSALDLGGRGRADFRRLELLEFQLQKIAVRRALTDALADPEPMVQAASLHGAVKAFGTGILAELLVELAQTEAQEVEARFAPELLLEVARQIRRGGLPELVISNPSIEISDRDRTAFRLRMLELMVDLGTLHSSSRVRNAYLRALQSATGEDLGPREEEWLQWWRAEREAWMKAERDAANSQSQEKALP